MMTSVTAPLGQGFTTGIPASAPNLLATTTGGLVGNGTYQYSVTYVTPYGETTAGPSGSVTTASSSSTVSLTNIAVSHSHIIARRIYRTKVNGSTFYLLATINDNKTTSYIDRASDASLPTTVAPAVNSADPVQYVGGFISFANFPLSNSFTLSTLNSASVAVNLGATHINAVNPTIANGLGTMQPLHVSQIGTICVVKNVHASNAAVIQPSTGNTFNNGGGAVASITIAAGAIAFLVSNSGTNWQYC